MPALFLLRASASSWYVVLWMPEGKVGVSNRMVYAASQPRLKAAVGDAHVADTLQFATLEEVFGNEGGARAEAAPAIVAPIVAPSAAPAVTPKPPGLQASRSFAQTATARVTTTTTTTTMRYQRTAESNLEQQQQQQQQQPARQGVFVKKADPRLAMSKSELEHVDMLQQEDEARAEQLSQAWSRLRSGPGPAQPAVDAANHH
ncbi:hypothetical protein H4R21_003092, partial [Coemansia helicoidea]